MQLVLATNNKDKIREIKHLLEDLPVTILTRDDFLDFPDPEETGTTLEENATLKAREIAAFCEMPALADDSGLEVEILGGEPGLHSHRYAPKPGATDHDRCVYLLSKLEGKAKPWLAAFHCHAVLYVRQDFVVDNHGTIAGQVIEEFHGVNGFGYDPIFWIPSERKTMAELDSQRKNQISHRARAFTNFLLLKQWIFDEV